MPVEFAEAAAELDVLLARDVLVAQEQDAMVEEGLVNLAERAFAHRLRDVDVADFRAQRVRQAAQFQSHDSSSGMNGTRLHALPDSIK